MNIFLKQHWKPMLIFFVILLIFFIGYFVYKHNQAVPQLDITNATDAQTTEQLKKEMPNASFKEREETTQALRKADSQPAQEQFTATSLTALDKKANEIAKEDEADFVTKEVNKKTDGTIEGVYKGVHLEKDNRLKFGITVQNGISYSVGYEHKNTEVLIHSKDMKTISGVTVMQTIAKW